MFNWKGKGKKRAFAELKLCGVFVGKDFSGICCHPDIILKSLQNRFWNGNKECITNRSSSVSRGIELLIKRLLALGSFIKLAKRRWRRHFTLIFL